MSRRDSLSRSMSESGFLLVQNQARNGMEGDSIAKTVNSPNNET